MVRLPGYLRFNPYASLNRKEMLFTMQPLYVGLDIDHKKIETSFVDQTGNLVSDPFSVTNDAKGANSLAERICRFMLNSRCSNKDSYFICPADYHMMKDDVDWPRRKHKNHRPHALSPDKYPYNRACF